MKTQTIFRSTHVRNYTVFSNDLIANPDLSWKAKGILLYLLSKPTDWQTRLEDVVNHAKDGKEAVQSGINELKAAGYLEKVRIVDPETKRVVRWETHVHEYPIKKPDPGNPDSGYPDSGKPAATNYGSTNKEKQNLDIDKRQPSGTAAPPDQADLSEREDSQGENEHTPLATDLNPSGPQRQTDRSKKVPPRQPWTPADGLGTDQQGWVKLPTTTQVVPKRREAVSRAKAQAVRSAQLWLVDQGIRGIEWVEEDGQDLIEHLNGTETAEEAFGRGGDLSLRKLRDLALDQCLITQEEFNATLEDFFWAALAGEQVA